MKLLLDASNPVNFLLEKRDHSLHVKFDTDTDAQLDRVFMEMPDAKGELFRDNAKLIIYDTTVRPCRSN